MPTFVGNLLEGSRTGSFSPLLIVGLIAMVVFLVLFISFMERAQRAGADPVSETRNAARRDAGGPQPLAAQGQHRWCDPADLRILAAAHAADSQSVCRE